MDPPDVEMEPAPEPLAQPPSPTPAAAAAGEGWSMLSRARELLQEGKPSLALQAVRPLSLSLALSLSSVQSTFCVLRVAFVPTTPLLMGWGILWFCVS